MPRILVAYNDQATNPDNTGPSLDLVTSHASGQLLIAAPSGPGGSYHVEVTLNQAPTISGPWSPVPHGGAVAFETTAEPGIALLPYQRSCRFLQVSATNDGAFPYGFSAFVIEPAPPLSFTAP